MYSARWSSAVTRSSASRVSSSGGMSLIFPPPGGAARRRRVAVNRAPSPSASEDQEETLPAMASWSPSPSCKQRTARRGVARTTCPRAGGASRVLRSELSSDEAGRRMCPETCPQLGRYDPVQRPPTPHILALGSQKRPASTDLLIRGSQVRILAGALVCRAKYRLPDGRQVQTTIGPVWTERGRPPEGYFTRRERRRPGCDRGGRGVPPLPGRRSPAQAVDRPRRALGHCNHLLPPFGERRLEDITEQEVERWARRLGADRPLSNATKRKVIVIFHGVMAASVRDACRSSRRRVGAPRKRSNAATSTASRCQGDVTRRRRVSSREL
jgi:hypothetical protein